MKYLLSIIIGLLFLTASLLHFQKLYEDVLKNILMVKMSSLIDSNVININQLLEKEKSFINHNIPATYEDRFAWRAMGFALANNELEDEAISYWQKSQGILHEFLLYGENEWKSRNYKDALFWYNRAIRIDTDAEVDWIKVGRTCQLHDPESPTGMRWKILSVCTSQWRLPEKFHLKKLSRNLRQKWKS